MDFSYSKEHNAFYTFLLKGDLIDRLKADSLMNEIETLLAEGNTKLILDVVDLKYMNSSGLNVLISILTKVRKAGGELVIVNVSKKVNDLLVLTKLNTIFIIADDRSDAEEKLKSIQ